MRRRRRENTLSLFSFQDIITGVAGVMLFILLLLVVQMTLRAATTPNDQFGDIIQEVASEPPPSQQPVDLTELRQMQRELEEMRRRSAELMDMTEAELDALVKAAREELDALMEDAAEKKSQAETLDSQLASSETSDQEKATLDQRNKLRQQVQQLEQQRSKHVQGKLVAFKAASSGVRELWIIDMRGTETSVFNVNSPEEAMTIEYERYAPAMEVVGSIRDQLQQRTKVRDVVLLLRPSIAGVGSEIMAAFQLSGYRVALELLDEDTQVARPVGAKP